MDIKNNGRKKNKGTLNSKEKISKTKKSLLKEIDKKFYPEDLCIRELYENRVL